jgi:cystathionine gamma-synthase
MILLSNGSPFIIFPKELLDFATGRHKSFEYGRYGNPTTQALENKLIAIEGVSSPQYTALATSSGMSATTTMIMSLVPKGGHIVTTKDCYRRTRQFIAVC